MLNSIITLPSRTESMSETRDNLIRGWNAWGWKSPRRLRAVEYSVILLLLSSAWWSLSAPRIRRSMITRLGMLVFVSAQF